MNFEEYEKIRPYRDNEVPAAIERIIREDKIKNILSFLYKGKNEDGIVDTLKTIKTVEEFQNYFSHYAVKEVIRRTSDGLTTSGIEKLDNSKPYLFVANHRDIVMDSAILQTILVDNNHKTSQITFGSNLMSSEFIIDLGKLNKMFTLYRGGSKIQRYRNALLHSKYIRQVITQEKESIWIAQRDGRTKDGDDKTQIGLINMFTMGRKDIIPALKKLNIVPVSISYEYEPCDAQKIQELYSSRDGEYNKQADEDLKSVLCGINNSKGHINLTFGTVLNQFLDKLETTDISIKEKIELILNEIDTQIYKNYSLWPGNYVAYDLFMKKDRFIETKYNQDQKDQFLAYISSKLSNLKGDIEELKNMFIKMYAMPVVNRLKIK